MLRPVAWAVVAWAALVRAEPQETAEDAVCRQEARTRAEFAKVLELLPQWDLACAAVSRRPRPEAAERERLRLGGELARLGYHPLLSEGLFFLPGGPPVKESRVTLDLSGKVVEADLEEPVELELASSDRALVRGRVRFDAAGRVVEGELAESVALARPEGGALRLRGRVVFDAEGRLREAELAEPAEVVLPEGRGVMARGKVLFDGEGRAVSVELEGETEVRVPRLGRVAVTALAYEAGRLRRVRFAGTEEMDLPTGKKGAVREVEFGEDGVVVRTVFAGPFEMALGVLGKVRVDEAVYRGVDVVEVRLSRPVEVETEAGKMFLRGRVVLDGQGRLREAELDRETPVLLPGGVRARCRGMLRFGAEGKVVEAELAQPVEVVLPTGDRAQVRGRVVFDAKGRLLECLLAGPAQEVVLANADRVPARGRLRFDEEGRVVEVELAEVGEVTLPTGQRVRVEALELDGEGRVSVVYTAETVAVGLPDGVKVRAKGKVRFGPDGGVMEAVMPLLERARVVLPTGERAWVTEVRYEEGRLVEAKNLAGWLRVTLPTGERVRMWEARFDREGRLVEAVLAPSAAVTVGDVGSLRPRRIVFDGEGRLRMLELPRVKVLRLGNRPVRVFRRICLDGRGEVLKVW